MSKSQSGRNTTIEETQFLLTASGAGKCLGVTGSAVVALSNRGKLPCVRDSANRRLYAMKDIRELQRQRAAAAVRARRS